MRSIKQLLRQPIKLFAGILLVSLSVAILTICIGQYTATDLSRENLDDLYTTTALFNDEYFWRTLETGGVQHLTKLPDEIQNWVDETLQTRSDLVKTISETGLVSAYIPELNIDNFSKYEYGYNMDVYNIGLPYRCAMLEITLTDIGTIYNESMRTFLSDGKTYEILYKTTVLCIGTIDRAIGLEQGFRSPVGGKILLYVTVYNKEDFDALNLQIGQRCLVYGMDYSDDVESNLSSTYKNSYEELFGPLQYKSTLVLTLDYSPILEQINCTMTVCDFSSIPEYTPIFDETNTICGFAALEEERLFYNPDDTAKYVPADEYIADYQVPTITALNGSTEDFLASESGALWQKTLDKIEINNHGFPVLCVDKLGYQASFSREQARIVEGRDFTEGELANGDKVCIISQTLAKRNGLKAGDSIELRAYAYDPNVHALQRSAMRSGNAFPSAALYSESLGFTSEMETYTVVGLYRQEDAWQNRFDDYGFTPNTIFVPKSSVTAEMITKNKGIYSTLVLENGKMEEFQTLMAEAGYPDLFICYDQGYSEFVASLDAYEEVSVKALYIGIAAYAVLMLLFVFLFPAMQRRALATMFSLGAPRGKRVGHIFVSSAVILLPGTIIGGFAGAKLWSQVADRLMQSLNIQIPLEANMPVIAPALAAAHLILMALVVLLAAIPLTQNNSTMKCK